MSISPKQLTKLARRVEHDAQQIDDLMNVMLAVHGAYTVEVSCDGHKWCGNMSSEGRRILHDLLLDERKAIQDRHELMRERIAVGFSVPGEGEAWSQ